MHSIRRLRSGLLAFLFTLCCASLPAANLKFTSTGLLTGGTYGYATAVSADGATVVGYGDSSSVTYEQAAVWTSAGGMIGLGDLPGGPTTSGSKAQAVSADGTVVVGFGTSAGRPIPTGGSTALTQEAFRWTATTGMVGLGVLPGSYLGTDARAVSADGSVIVGLGYNASGFPEAFRWTAATGLQALGFLPGCNQSTATGVSADGSVIVGFSSGSGIPSKAFRWTQAGGMVELGALPPAYVTSHASAISADGLVVVGQVATPVQGDGSANREAFRWTQAGGYVVLGDLPGIEVRSEALAVSADGAVVVGSATGSTSADNSFMWDATNGLRSLRTLLTQAEIASGWSLTAASGISADGTKIVGFGSGASQSTGWLLDLNAPPPPAPTVVLAWTEDLPQTVPLKSNAVLRLGYDNGTGRIDIATQTTGDAGFNGVEYAEGSLLVANQGAGTGTRIHNARYAPIIVTNLTAYDLHATTGYLWQVTGGTTRVLKLAPSGGFTIAGSVIDRTFTTLRNRNASRFTNAVHTDGATTYFSSTSNPAGLYTLSAALLQDQATLYTTGSPAIYDFEVVGDYIYFANINANTIQRINKDGTGLVTLVTGATFANGIDVTDTHIYWSEFTTGLIRRANLDGSNPVTLIEGRNGLRGVAVLPLSIIDGPAPQSIAIGGLAPTYNGTAATPVPLTPVSTSGLPVSLEIVSGPATLSGNSITYTATGTVHVRATQAGDPGYAPAIFDAFVTTTIRLPQSIDFPQPADVTYAGTPVVFTPAATASSGLVVFYTVVTGPATYDTPSGAVTVTGTGSITLRATQSGSGVYAPATPVERTFASSAPGTNPFADFLIAAGVPAGQRGALDDPDKDSIPNLLEYALGLAPNTSDASAMPGAVNTGTHLTLTYRRAQPGLTYAVETSPTLTSGTWTTTGVNQGWPDGNGLTTATIPLGPDAGFLRVSVTMNP